MMKKNLLLFVVLLFAVGTMFAQEDPTNDPNSGEPQALFDLDPSDWEGLGNTYDPHATSQTSNTTQNMMAITFYTDRPSFEAAACNVLIEDMQNPVQGGIFGCGEPISSTSGNCYPVGELIPGFEGTTPEFHPGADFALVPQGSFGVPSTCIVPNFFTDAFRLDFPGNDIYSVGWDHYDFLFTGGFYTVDVFGTGGLIGTTTFNGGGTTFVGVTADEPIVGIDFDGGGIVLEAIDNLSIGTSCGGGADACLTDPCVDVVCPPDVTVACIDDVVIDPADAMASSTCGGIVGQWVTNPDIEGVPGCPGTIYRFLYKAVDSAGNVGCCERVIEIQNAPPTLDVPASETVACYESIPDVSTDDITVNDACANYNLYVSGPDVVGSFGCPGTQYIYTYRLVEACGRIVEAQRTFTEGANAPPSITAPDDITCECLGGVNPNPNNAEVASSCGADYTVTVTGPQIFGPIDCPNTVYRYTYTVVDACGRTDTDFQDFTVNNGPPEFDGCPGDNWLHLNCEDFGGQAGTIAVIEAWMASVTASTSCSVPVTVFNNFNSTSFINTHTCGSAPYEITFRATDNCGRTSFCSGFIVIDDTEAPIITGEAQDVWELCNYNTPDNFDDWVDNNGGATADDECWDAAVNWSTSPANPSLSCMGQMGTTSVTVTFIATDRCGNSSETTATYNALMGGGDFVDQGENDQLDDRAQITLDQNRPNPFKDETLISFSLAEASAATLIIYDVNGKVVKVVEGTYSAGYNEVSVNSSDFGSTGVMYYRLMTDKDSVTKTMLVID